MLKYKKRMENKTHELKICSKIGKEWKKTWEFKNVLRDKKKWKIENRN